MILKIETKNLFFKLWTIQFFTLDEILNFR